VNNIKILIVEDDFRLLAEWKLLLEEAGYEVSIAPNATQATPMLNQHFDCYIIDLFHVQGNDFLHDGGISIISQIRTYHLNRNNPLIIAVTGYYNERDSQVSTAYVAGNLGANITIKKPLNPADLIEIIEKWKVNSNES